MAVVVQVRWSRHPLSISQEAQSRAEAAVAKAAEDIVNVAQGLVRVDTGNLKNSIQVENESPLSATAGPRGVDYDYFQEYGTSRMSGRAYMRPASQQVGPQFLSAMRQIIG